MPESVPTNEPDISKRRSTRIVQAVPLTVVGVDALGRPFSERTSTLIINCHGCRYQSKHYVLKNMWVTFEVPHQEAGHPARTVRARVMWIQRPRTVRELFQVGVELEVSGNFWGIAFPPSDWFPFPEGLAAVPLPPVAAIPAAAPAESPWPAASPVTSAEGNVRTMQAIPAIPALQPAVPLDSSSRSEIETLIEEAKKDLQATLRRSAAEAVSLEARPLISSLELQLKGLAEKSLEAAAGSVAEKALQEAKQVQVDAFRQECNRSMAEGAKRAVQELASQLEEVEKQRSATFEQILQQRIQEALDRLQKQAAELRPPVAPAADQAAQIPIPDLQRLEQRIQAQIEQANVSLSEIENVSRHLRDQAASAFSSAQADWQARVEAEFSAAAGRWHQQVGSSVESAKQQFVERLARHAESAGEHVERELALRIGGMTKAFADAATYSEAKLSQLRTSLDQENERALESLRKVQTVEHYIENQAAKLHGITHAVEQALEQRASALLEAQSEEMARRASDAITAWAERLQPVLEATGQQTVTRLAAQIKAELKDRVESAAAMVARLESTIGSADEALRLREETLARASDHAIQAAGERVKELVSALTRDFSESGRAAADKWISEIDAKATDTTHHAFESLFKTAEWYEKKVHT